MLVERILKVEQHTLNLASSAEAGPALVLLHGVIRRWQDWMPLLPALRCRWQTLALDFRGHGRSGRADGAYQVRDYLQDGLAVVDAVADSCVIFGHSLGALVALGAAACRPEKVRALILEDPPSPRFLSHLRQSTYHAQFVAMQQLAGSSSSIAEITKQLAAIQLPGPKGPVRLGDLRDATSLRFLASCLKMLDPQVLLPVIESHWHEETPLEEWAQQVRCPVLLLRGNETLGGMLPKQDAEQWFYHTADLTQIDISHAGHLIHGMETQITLRLVSGFLESLS